MEHIIWNNANGTLDGTQACTENARVYKKIQYIKIIHKMWAVNKRQHEWKQSDSPKCPFCKTEDETRMHLLTCNNIVAKSFRKLELAKVQKELRRVQTAPLLTNYILQALHQFHNNYSVTMVDPKN